MPSMNVDKQGLRLNPLKNWLILHFPWQLMAARIWSASPEKRLSPTREDTEQTALLHHYCAREEHV